MTPPESPSALLERAAAALGRLAEDAPQAPWRIAGDGDMLGYGPVPIIYSEYGDVEVRWAPGMSEWLIAMSPAVAPPLVEWLRKTAQHFAGMDEVHPLDPAVLAQRPGQYGYEAVSFARAVLGET